MNHKKTETFWQPCSYKKILGNLVAFNPLESSKLCSCSVCTVPLSSHITHGLLSNRSMESAQRREETL